MAQPNDLSISTKQKNVEKANKSKNPCETLTDAFQYKSASGNEFKLYCRTKADLEPKVLKWAFKLAERNMAPLYRELKMGWQPKVKQNDLNKNWARYLVALDQDKKPVAYAMFRFDIDYEYSVLYCYELQIEEPSRRQGLGKFMMHTLELCARHWNMEKIVLTVLKNNKVSLNFFKIIGYLLDESSPGILEDAEYEILSKSMLD